MELVCFCCGFVYDYCGVLDRVGVCLFEWDWIVGVVVWDGVVVVGVGDVEGGYYNFVIVGIFGVGVYVGKDGLFDG